MQELINHGIRQGTILRFPEDATQKSDSVQDVTPFIANGRFGEAPKLKGVSPKSVFVVLTQDCTIAGGGSFIELAQLNTEKVKDERKISHILLGQDYSKLIVNIEDLFFAAEERYITKIKKTDLLDAINKEYLYPSQRLPDRSCKILIDWRVLTYLREPYPHNFNDKLKTYLRESEYWFTDFLLQHQCDIHSIRLYVTPEDVEDAEQYQFALCALLSESGEHKQEEIELSIFKMLEQFNEYDGIDCLQTIDLDSDGINIPEHLVMAATSTLDEFTFANAYVMREFNFQYLCY